MPSVMAARCMGRSKLWSYFSSFVDQSSSNIKGPAGEIAVCKAVFHCCVSETFARSSRKFADILIFWAAIFFLGGGQFLTEFYKSESLSNMLQVW